MFCGRSPLDCVATLNHRLGTFLMRLKFVAATLAAIAHPGPHGRAGSSSVERTAHHLERARPHGFHQPRRRRPHPHPRHHPAPLLSRSGHRSAAGQPPRQRLCDVADQRPGDERPQQYTWVAATSRRCRSRTNWASARTARSCASSSRDHFEMKNAAHRAAFFLCARAESRRRAFPAPPESPSPCPRC